MMDVVDADRIDFVLPDWVRTRAAAARPLEGDEPRMRLVIDLSREQVVRGAGGPFAAAVFETATGRLVAAGVNLVEQARNSVLHAEVVALMLAERRLESYSLSAAGLPPLELVTSSTPCAMCLGAVLWSGVRRLVCGARTEDVRAIGFDEGPVYPESFAHLERRGIAIVRDVCRDDAARVLREYARTGGLIYNP
jgi:tRNA(Arg) A34 adenosine deaminase TadA